MTVHKGTVNSRTHFYDDQALAWVPGAQPSTSAGAGSTAASSTQVSVSNYSTIVFVSNFPAQSTIVSVANQVRVSNSTIGDLLASVQQNSTVWQVQQGGYVAPSTDARVSPLAGSTWNTRTLQSSAADLQMTATPASGSTWNTRTLQSSAADLQMTATPAAGSTWNVRPLQSSAADLQMTATPLAGSTWNVRALQSSAADLNVTCTPLAGSTWNVRAFCSSAGDFHVVSLAVDGAGNTIETSTRAVGTNSTMRGMSVRSILPDCTTASGLAGTAGDNTLISSATTSIYVYAYSLSMPVISTAANLLRFQGGSTVEIWRIRAPQGGSTTSNPTFEAHLAVSPPAYLFRTGAALPLVLNTTSSGVSYAVAAWRE